jgi:hypothetical protein
MERMTAPAKRPALPPEAQIRLEQLEARALGDLLSASDPAEIVERQRDLVALRKVREHLGSGSPGESGPTMRTRSPPPGYAVMKGAR